MGRRRVGEKMMYMDMDMGMGRGMEGTGRRERGIEGG
jgi:hypothetical protein